MSLSEYWGNFLKKNLRNQNIENTDSGGRVQEAFSSLYWGLHGVLLGGYMELQTPFKDRSSLSCGSVTAGCTWMLFTAPWPCPAIHTLQMPKSTIYIQVGAGKKATSYCQNRTLPQFPPFPLNGDILLSLHDSLVCIEFWHKFLLKFWYWLWISHDLSPGQDG